MAVPLDDVMGLDWEKHFRLSSFLLVLLIMFLPPDSTGRPAVLYPSLRAPA
jgi:hypothetical protein